MVADECRGKLHHWVLDACPRKILSQLTGLLLLVTVVCSARVSPKPRLDVRVVL